MNGIRRVVVGVDFSARSRTAAEMAMVLARRDCASIEFVHVIEANPERWEARVLGLDTERIRQTLVDEATRAIGDLKAALGCDGAGERVLFGNAAQQLTNYCTEVNADLLAVGNAGAKSIPSSSALGTTAYRLVERGPDRLLVTKPSYHGKLDRVAAAVDYTPVSDQVVEEAAELAEVTSAELFVVHAYSTAFLGQIGVVSGPNQLAQTLEQLKTISEKRIKEFVAERLPGNVDVHADAVAGSERAALADYLMDKAIDVVVVGTGTGARLLGYPIGSVTHGILHETMSSVLVVRSHD